MNRHSRHTLPHQIAATFLAIAWAALPVSVSAQDYRHDHDRGRPPAHYDHDRYDQRNRYEHYDRDDQRNRYEHYDRDDRYRGHDNSGAIIAGALLGVAAGAVIVGSTAPQPPPTVVYTSPPPPTPPGVVYYEDNGY